MQRRHRMNSGFIAVLLGVVGALATKEKCLSGQFTNNGECCLQCQPGEGVVSPCGATQTVCAPCLDSETFSENLSHTEKCQSCTECTGLFRMDTPCTDSNDAICVCNYGYYFSVQSERCEPCTKCAEGYGMLFSCEMDHDTICEECNGDTYSDQESSREPCIPCTTCEEGQLLYPCNSTSDTVCQVQYPSVSPTSFMGSFLPTDGNLGWDLPPDGPTDSTTTTTTDGDSHKRLYQGLNDKLIPIYCSILAAVVVGVVAFIIFKRWNSCKQNKQGANNCTTNQNQTPSPEGEKLHSDSGISVDSQSLQEQQGQSQLSPWMKSLVCSFLFTPERKWRSCCSGAVKKTIATTWTIATGATWLASWDTRRSGSKPSGRKSILSVHSCLTGQERSAPAWTRCARHCARSTVMTLPKAWCSGQVLQSRLPLLLSDVRLAKSKPPEP
ncbi:nerve growth factor receptor b isoform X1 [Channa argus]|uniref:nerve growth factor receptor b isoform X1 n=1 Tax=Channa argus TaxID=215402 RepID=UPI00352289B8